VQVYTSSKQVWLQENPGTTAGAVGERVCHGAIVGVRVSVSAKGCVGGMANTFVANVLQQRDSEYSPPQQPEPSAASPVEQQVEQKYVCESKQDSSRAQVVGATVARVGEGVAVGCEATGAGTMPEEEDLQHLAWVYAPPQHETPLTALPVEQQLEHT
jgi:hypothetical protein